MPNPFADSLDALPYEPHNDLQLPDLESGDGWRSSVFGLGASGSIELRRDADPGHWWVQVHDLIRHRASTTGPVIAAAVPRIVDRYLDDLTGNFGAPKLLGWKPASLRVDAGRIVEADDP